MAVDRELPEDELEQLERHLAGCSSCQKRFEDHGELDMLLKSHLSHEPEEGYCETLWPAVSERLDEGSSAGGGGDDAVVFKSSPAMDYLNIPDRKPAPRSVAEPTADEPTAPPSEASPWRWPLALMVSTAIVVVGYLAYKKMSPPPPQTLAAAANETPPDEDPALSPTSQPASDEPGAGAEDAGMHVAALTGGEDAGASGSSRVDDDPSDKPERRSHRPRRRRHRKGKKERKAAAAKPEAKPKPEPEKPKKKGKPKKPGKPSSLDSLLDDAIGGKEPAKKKASPAAAKPAASDLPEQLNMNQIRSAMSRVKGRVQACYDQYQVEGMANVRFKIKGDGSITNVSIRGKFRGTDTGACVVKAVKTASFPKFSGKPMTIKNYPFLLQ